NEEGLEGPRVVPGKYQVRLTSGKSTQTAPVVVVADPRSAATQGELEQQYTFLKENHDKLTEIHEQIEKIRAVRNQLNDLKKRLKKEDKYKSAVDAATELDKKMTAI